MPSLRVVNLSKSYGAVHAVRGASVTFEAGGIHAVVGENGAGKSTLLKMAAGVVTADDGEVTVDGARLQPHTAAEAIRRGVGMVQQHFALIGVFTALENVVLGYEPPRMDLGLARRKMAEIARELGAEIALDARVDSMGVGDRQRLEIARALYREARVLILDEPTAVLTPGESDALYATLRRLADAGRAIVVVTHKLDEVRDHADFVSVMRAGELVSTQPMRETETAALAAAIMGGDMPPPLTRERDEHDAATPHGAALVLRRVTSGRALRGVSLEVRRGEIVGIAGVEGNGQRELVRVLARLDPPDSGSFEAAGVAVVHEDRHVEGLVLDASVGENLVLGELRRFARLGLLDVRAMSAAARERMDHARITPAELDLPARSLSGGNQQKIVVARAVARTAGERGREMALVLAHPTRGVDVGAARAIHGEILAAAKRGVGVLVVSADLHELRALADRILVMSRGEIVQELPPTASDRAIGEAMLGARRGDA